MADFDRFEELGIQILGIANSTVFAQKSFAESLELSFPLLSDSRGQKVIKSYGLAERENFRIVARPAFFLIDKDGIVRGAWITGDSSDSEINPFEVFPSKPILELVREIQSAK